MWKKKEKKKQEKEEEKGEDLLKDLCGDDEKLYNFLTHFMYINPLTAISKKDLDILTEEAEKSGNFGPAVDKAIFEAAQNPGERERYIKVIQNLASKTIHATEQKKEKAQKEGLTDLAASLADCAGDTPSQFYNEKLLELGENARRNERVEERREAEREEKRIEDLEKAGREARKKERSAMGRKEKREAKKQDKREELAAEERKEERSEERRKAEREEKRIEDLEKAGREARKKERRGD